MIEIVLIRHGSTSWNELNRYQGRTDVPLSEKGKLALQAMAVPEVWMGYRHFSSPLLRAQQSAQILFPEQKVEVDSRLVEVDFGAWEGEFVEQIRQTQDFSPPSYGWQGWNSGPPKGETNQQVADRLMSWLNDVSKSEQNVVAVTHKGVILVALALAHQWDMASKRPFKVHKGCYQILSYSAESGLQVKALNQPL